MQTSGTTVVCVSMLITCLHEKLGFHLGKNVYPALVAVGGKSKILQMWLYCKRKLFFKKKENFSKSEVLLLKIISSQYLFPFNYTDAMMCTV